MLAVGAPVALRAAAAAAARRCPAAAVVAALPRAARAFGSGKERPLCLSDRETKKLIYRGKEIAVAPEFWTHVADEQSVRDAALYKNNTENYIGTVKYPCGVVGPLRVNGEYANKDYIVPLCTHEGALLASYDRGAKAITQAGGVTVRIKSRGMLRAPVFVFKNIVDAADFRKFAVAPETKEKVKQVVEQTISHCKVSNVRIFMTDRKVHVSIAIDSDDASGMNIVTYAADCVMEWMKKNYHGTIPEMYIEGGFNAGKRVSVMHTLLGKGHAVVADVVVPKEVVKKTLHTTPYRLQRFQKMHSRTNEFIGGISCTAHVANGLAAFYIASGQDPACVGESQAAVTHFDIHLKNGSTDLNDCDLYASMTLNSLILATVGGGTNLPAFKAARSMMGIRSANELAEVCAGVALGGEMSFYAAMESAEFTKAHWNMTHK